MAVHRKMDALLSLQPDVAVLQECAHPDVALAKAAYARATDFRWAGDIRTKGMAVLSFGDARLSGAPRVGSGTTIATRVLGLAREFNLLGKWAWVKTSSLPGYVKDVREAIDLNEPFLRDGDAVVAGDLNSSSFFDGKTRGGHTALVARLAELGLQSAYHARSGEEPGKETRSTFFRKKPQGEFHIDYVFLPSSWIDQAKVDVPNAAQWLKLSDHVPVVVDVS